MKTLAHLLPLFCLLHTGIVLHGADSLPAWPSVTLPAPRDVDLRGPVGAALQRGVARLAQDPYTADWLLADVSFKVNRIFTNYSGDASGRFLELASLTSPRGQFMPPALASVMAQVASYQKPDGHFGLDMDFDQPLKKLSPPIPMLWGNARLLVGLVTAARESKDPTLLAAARRLGDFYVNSAPQLCSPARETEYRATGTYGDGYTCCYFPAIESLALLYRATQEERYLNQAKRMADFFQKFDVLPVEHSHGNLCAWRGILELYDLTHDRVWLDRTRAKWEAAVNGGYVWPIGGVGEHWAIFFPGDEGCSESDWLRLNLELWRFTGDTRYLDMAERLLHNQYAANQCSNGGYGWCPLEGDESGPVAKRGQVDEWNFCCSFHGPLGLHWLKAYLAAGSERGVWVNFPLDFTVPIQVDKRTWRVSVQRKPGTPNDPQRIELELAPTDRPSARTTLWLRVPGWATAMTVTQRDGTAVATASEQGYLRVEREFKAGEKLVVSYASDMTIEARRFKKIQPTPDQISRLKDVSLVKGPDVLFAIPAGGNGRETLLAMVNRAGRLDFPRDTEGRLVTVPLPGPEATAAQIASALETEWPVALRPWTEVPHGRRAAFAHHLVVVPSETLPATALAKFTERTRHFTNALTGPFFGENLDKQAGLWVAPSGWQFSTNGIHVTGGDIGLLDGEGYADYRFEFELTLPLEGQGIAGWVVRANNQNDCLMFQLQSADSPYHAPEFKTAPNTLRPHVRRGGQWTIADPIPLPRQIRRGETHRIAVECRGEQVTVFLDSERIHGVSGAELRQGTVGFRAAGPGEQGIYRRIVLRKL